MPDQTPAPLTDDELRQIAASGWAPQGARLATELLATRACITELEAAATLSAVCRAPEIHDRPTDADLARVVRALEGTGDAVYVLGSEVIELRARVADLDAEQRTVGPDTSDGCHTFAELYHYRMLYNAAAFNAWAAAGLYDVHKSWRHSDGEECFGGGWFVVYAELPTGQISNHYEAADWDRFRIPERETAIEWDGHTPQRASQRLAEFLELESEPSAAARRPPAGYVVGWPEGDGRVNIALDEADLPLEGADTLAYTSVGEAYAFLAECGPGDPDIVFRVYELRQVADRD
ncbi:hypothetical protein GV794_02085 [Nocardia cyriacigeorgica]|uniref:WDGH domain-containing protein n=1 Tax=Nocardia cyriacigeorgica TaxID=135487 RepID=A0ABX0CJD8_9NOCA|nr:hypothetical protein [Nocardia cyriacigeorgica]NEW42750.1 hypothetical protein [Nocardia cyriacigeorgica]NEW53955.1 hypothetical protein [Nocardia cyriacigeorgica]NEW54456.1 hypothetical protein [Nocardia cyriacigeorgica]